jgi:hypothetical protein
MTMNARSLFAIATGILFALGCGYIGWILGLGAFAIAFEILRERALEGALDSKNALEHVRTIAWFIGVAAGAFAFWRWQRSGGAFENAGAFKRWTVSGIAVAGAVHLNYLLTNGVAVEAMVTIAFLSFVGGSALVASAYGRPGFASWIGRFFIAAICGFAILFVALAFDKRVAEPYDALGRERILWVKIAFTENAAMPEPENVKAELRMPGGNTKCSAIAWEHYDGRLVLPIRCDFTELTLDRELAVTLPGEQPKILKMPFARNPKPMFDYSGWVTGTGGTLFRYRVT